MIKIIYTIIQTAIDFNSCYQVKFDYFNLQTFNMGKIQTGAKFHDEFTLNEHKVNI